MPAKPRISSQRGFTLIEITFAVLILAGSFVVVLGLQSSAVRREVADRNRQSAMLVARRILTAVETLQGEIPEMNEVASPREIIEQLTRTPMRIDEEDRIEEFTAELRVEPWGLPQLDPDVMRRLVLRVYWANFPDDAIEVVYYLPREEERRNVD